MAITKGDVLAYLQGLSSPSQINQRFVIGQLTAWQGGGVPDADVPPIVTAAGVTPGLVAAFWGEIGESESAAHWANPNWPTRITDGIAGLIGYWTAGCLIKVVWFPASLVGPTTASGFLAAMNANPYGRFDPTTPPTYPWNVAALVSGVATCAQWRQGVLVTGLTFTQVIDYFAAYLIQLRDAGVVVIFSPWNEFDTVLKGPGNIAWRMLSAADFIDLWHFVHDRFTALGLTNLIWEWPLLEGDSLLNGAMAYYPGDAYVDIVSWSNYGDATNPEKDAYDPLVATGKIVMLSEFGPDILNGGGPGDLNAWVEATKANMPKLVGAMAWGGAFGIADQTNVVVGMANPWLVTQPVPVLELAPVADFNATQVPGTRTIQFEDTSV